MQRFRIFLTMALCITSIITLAKADDEEVTTTEFGRDTFIEKIVRVTLKAFIFSIDPSSRGSFKFGDKCEMTQQCGFAGSICYQSYCTCSPEFMSTNHVDKCGKGLNLIIKMEFQQNAK